MHYDFKFSYDCLAFNNIRKQKLKYYEFVNIYKILAKIYISEAGAFEYLEI